MFIIFRKWTALYVISLVFLVVSFILIMQEGETVHTVSTDTSAALPIIIIDPGHGGEDGGAVAPDGTIESGINLSIAIKAQTLAEFLGWQVIMTRTEDISIHDSTAVTLREKKVSDLKNRTELCNSTENSVLISIHQNSLPSAKSVRGAQVFYSDTAGSKELAESIQLVLNRTLNQNNAKSSKQISGSYLMTHILSPAVLVECGFLSNESETKQLKTTEYQLKMALCIITAATLHLQNIENNTGF